MRILVTGASGSGTSTLGAALAKQLGARFIDADDFFWLPTDPPYTAKRAPEERLAQMLAVLESSETAVVAGSIMGWGDVLENTFALVIFLQVDMAVRLKRLQDREIARFGSANAEFLAWAAQYDVGPPEGRSLARHNAWLAARSCPVIRFAGERSTAEQLAVLTPQIAQLR